MFKKIQNLMTEIKYKKMFENMVDKYSNHVDKYSDLVDKYIDMKDRYYKLEKSIK